MMITASLECRPIESASPILFSAGEDSPPSPEQEDQGEATLQDQSRFTVRLEEDFKLRFIPRSE
jgi:hypothetical protein